MTDTIAPYRYEIAPGRDGFAPLVHAEWTKFRTVRGWVIGCLAAVLLIVLLAILTGSGSHTETCVNGKCRTGGDVPTTGPGGQPVTDRFYFVHQPLAGAGSITVRVTSLTGEILPGGGVAAAAGSSGGSNPPPGAVSAVQPWAKAGVIVKESTQPGSPYAAVMVTGSHGVRMQDNFTHDRAGRSGAVSATSPRWLRLTRSGSTLTGYESSDGVTWTKVGTVRLSGLSSTVQVGMFVASPPYEQFSQHLGGGSGSQAFTIAGGTFDRVSVQGGAVGTWSGSQIEQGDLPPPAVGKFQQAGDTFTVSGAGDIAPVVGNRTGTIERTLVGAFAGLIVLIVLAGQFIAGEYRRGLIRTTLAASPRRARVLAAKALVIGTVAFAVGLLGAAIAVPLGERILRSNGNFIYPVSSLTGLRVIAGTAAVLAVGCVLALALGTILRRSTTAVTAVVVVMVLPYILSVSAVLPAGIAQWLLRLTPAAGFAIQQSTPAYSQVAAQYTPINGYFPLSPWVGFAVLCAWAAAAAALAAVLLRRRDA
ncbi:MAG: hypothetical protein QOJ11_507 [Frankiales bacterium]|jgi:ABC-type transport system involved in multi-copper enzyme maturation permease subunit|nr:hypothetical protein [Frankiales bacterium]